MLHITKLIHPLSGNRSQVLTLSPPQATSEPHPPTDVAVENKQAGISHTVSGELLPSL